MILKRVGYKSIKALAITESIVDNLANSEQYIDTISRHLKTTGGLISTEADMQIFLGCPTMFAYFGSFSKHRVFSEYKTATGYRIDHIFIPIGKRSDTIVMHEYKKKLGTYPNEEGILNLLENACWQIYGQDYLSESVNIYNSFREALESWKYISARAILIYKDSLDGCWKLRAFGLITQ